MNLMPPSFRRVLAVLGLGVAFVAMASIFVPRDTRGMDGFELLPGPGPIEPLHREAQLESADAHEGLRSIGSIEHGSYVVVIYATEHGPRYTIHDRGTDEVLGTLLREDQVEQQFPELPIDGMRFGGPMQLMLVPPHSVHPPF